MRKQKLKKYLKFGILLFGISILFVNCEKDYYEIYQLENNSKISVKILNQKQVESNKEIASKLQQINTELKKESNLILAKGIYNKDYDFTIDTDYVKYIEKGDYHSYNFSITRNNPNDKRVENLLLSLNNQGGYDAFIIKYDFSKEEYKNIDKTKLKKGTTEYIPIDFDTSNFSDGVFAKSTLRFICVETWVYISCTIIYGNHEDGLCNDHWALESLSCSWVDTGGKDYDYVDNGSTNDGTSDNCDNCGANGGTNADGSETTIISVPIMFSFEYTQFYKTLNFQQKKWCDDNYYLIDGFLSQNGYSEQTENFVVLAIDIIISNLTQEQKIEQLINKLDELYPLIISDNQIDYERDMRRMIKHLREFGDPEDEFFADYVESLIPDFPNMNHGEVFDIYKLTRKQVHSLTGRYLMKIVTPFAEAAYPFVQYALIDATLGLAIPLLAKIPLSMVTRGARLNKMVKQLAKLGSAGTGSHIRLIPNGSYTKTLNLFNKISQNAISPVTTQNLSNGRIRKIANMGNGNYITFRNFDYSNTPNLAANIDLNFPAIWSKVRELKFIR